MRQSESSLDVPQRTTASATRRQAGLLLSAFLVGGCGIFNPYRDAVVARPTSEVAPHRLELTGGAEDAMRYAEQVRTGYYDNLAFSAWSRSAAAVAAVGLTGWALYNAFEPTGADTVNLGDKRRAARLGVGLASLYGLRQFFLNPGQEKVYAQAYQDLTCLMYQASPLLMTQLAPGRTNADGGDPPWQSALVPSATVEQRSLGDVERLEEDMQLLREQIVLVWTLVDQYDARVDAIGGSSKEVKQVNRYFRDRSRDTRRALRYANNALYDAGNLLDAAKRVGGRIRSHVGLVVANANEAVQAKQNDLPDGNALLKSSQGLATSIKSIGVDTEADQMDLAASTSVAKVSDAGASLVPLMQPVQWRPGTGAPRLRTVAATTADVAPPHSSTGTKAATTSTPAARKPVHGSSKPKPPGGPAPAPTIASADGLKKIRKEVDAAIASIEKSEAYRLKKDDLDALKQARRDLRDGYYAMAAAALKCESQGRSGEACLDNLLVQTEKLYALRRPLAQALSNLQSRVRRVADSPDCAERATLRVVPTDALRVPAGSTIEYLITQKNDGENPIAVLQGPAEDKTGASLKLEAIGSTKLTKVVLKLGERMATQRIRVVVSDSRQLSTQILIVNVVGACKASTDGDDATDNDCKAVPPATPAPAPPNVS